MITFRDIQPEDNVALAKIIRNALKEHGAALPGTVFFDKDTDRLYEIFQAEPKSHYFVALNGDSIVGGGGVYHTAGLPEDTVELVKMYLDPTARGLGIGKTLIQKAYTIAKEMGFNKMYIESLPQLTIAVKIYENEGFRYLENPLGNSGHSGCDVWMIKDL